MPRVQELGNNLAVRIPAKLANDLGLRLGQPVGVTLEDDAIVIRPSKRVQYSLRKLLRSCKRAHFHGEFDWGEDVGRERIR